MIASADVVIRLYGLLTEFVAWQNETCWLPGPLVGGFAGVGPAVVVSAAAVVDVVVDGSVEVVVGVVLCAPALAPPSTKTTSAPDAIPTTVARRTRASYGGRHEM
jgi:hypothetical protein